MEDTVDILYEDERQHVYVRTFTYERRPMRASFESLTQRKLKIAGSLVTSGTSNPILTIGVMGIAFLGVFGLCTLAGKHR